MVTVMLRENKNNTLARFDFAGLSSDTKPTKTYDGYAVENGSSFLEIDNSSLYFYDAKAAKWYQFGG